MATHMCAAKGVRQGLLHDGADGPHAAAAIRATAKTTIDLGRRAWAAGPGTQAGFHITVGEDVAGANDHGALV